MIETANTTPHASAPLEAVMADLMVYTDCCSLLKMSRTALDRIANDPFEGFPPRIRLGRKFFVSRGALLAWIGLRVEGL